MAARLFLHALHIPNCSKISAFQCVFSYVFIIIIGVDHVSDYNLDIMTVNASLLKYKSLLPLCEQFFNAQQYLHKSNDQINMFISIKNVSKSVSKIVKSIQKIIIEKGSII
jgi:hypothetical protein